MLRISDIPAFRDPNLRLHGADIATQRSWTGVPNFILESKEISVGAKLTYAMLLKYARELNECFPGQERLANDMGCGVHSIVRYIAELSNIDQIKNKRRERGRPDLPVTYN